MNSIRRSLLCSVVLALVAATLFIPSPVVHAAGLTTPIIRSVSLGPPRGEAGALATLGYIEQENLIVHSVNRRTGLREGSDLVIAFPESRTAVRPVQLLFSTVLRPGSLLVLDSALQVHEFQLGFTRDNTPFVVGGAAGEIVHGPFGDPSLVGEATAMAESPGGVEGTATLVLGTQTGGIIAVLVGLRVPAATLSVSNSPIEDLAVVPQVGYFAFVAVTNGRLVGINADADSRTAGLQPAVSFDLISPQRAAGLVDISAGITDGTSNTLTSPAPVPFVAANGSTDVFLFDIPADPGFGSPLVLEGINRLGSGIREVAAGSIGLLYLDATAVLYQPNFTLERGFRGATFTVAGATMRLDPQTLNLRSRGRYVTALIDVANGGAADINPDSLKLQVEGVVGSVDASRSFRARLEGEDDEDDDDDGEHNQVLIVKFDRDDVIRLMRSVGGDSARVEVGWTLSDGRSGAASSLIRIID